MSHTRTFLARPVALHVVGRPSRRVAPRVIRRADSAHREAIARAGRGGGQREGGRLAILDETCRFGVNVNGPVFTVRWMPAPAPSNHDNTVRDRSRPLSIERQRSEVIRGGGSSPRNTRTYFPESGGGGPSWYLRAAR